MTVPDFFFGPQFLALRVPGSRNQRPLFPPFADGSASLALIG